MLDYVYALGIKPICKCVAFPPQMGLGIGILVDKDLNKSKKNHFAGEGHSGTGNPHIFINDANNAPVAGLGCSSSRVCTIAFISSARSCAVICFFMRQSL